MVQQPCIERDGNLSWGRRFVIAYQVSAGSPLAARHGLPGRMEQ